MSPLKITIPGAYWDSFLYAGRLYLFERNGSIRCLDWDRLIAEWPVTESARIAFECAFRRSDYLYSSDVQTILRDADVLALMQGKFAALGASELEVSQRVLSENGIGHQENLLPFPHADLEIYAENIYAGSSRGLASARCGKKTKHPISTKVVKRWDGPALALSASYGSLAVASGTDGLHELPLESNRLGHSGPTKISESDCRECSWNFYSIYASSDNSGYLAEFRKESESSGNALFSREFEGIKTAQQIFGAPGYSWGVHDKLCQAFAGEIRVVKYRPWAKEPHGKLTSLGVVAFEPWKGDVVSASTAPFGVIVELENAMVIFPSIGTAITLPGEPVNWRVFSRSKHYENQLHLVRDDCLEIYSFNHDYLVNQDGKTIGTTVFSRGFGDARRGSSRQGSSGFFH